MDMHFTQASVGGLLTLLCTIGVLVFAGFTLRDTFNRETYLLDHHIRMLYDRNLTIGDLKQAIY